MIAIIIILACMAQADFEACKSVTLEAARISMATQISEATTGWCDANARRIAAQWQRENAPWTVKNVSCAAIGEKA